MSSVMGAVLIICAGTGFGLAALRELNEALSRAKAALSMVETMRTEVCCRMQPIPAVMAGATRRMGRITAADALYSQLRQRPFSELWEDWVTMLDQPPETQEALLTLGFGLSGGEPPERVFARCVDRLSEIVSAAGERRDKNARLCVASGVSIGAMLAITLL